MELTKGYYEQISLSIINVQRAAYSSLHLKEIQRPYWVLSHVLEGEVEMHSGGRMYRVQEGDVMIHPPHINFNEYNPGKGIHQVLYLDLSLSSQIELLRLYPVFPVVRLKNNDHYSRLFERLRQYWTEPMIPERDFMISLLALQLVGEVVMSWAESGKEPRPSPLHSIRDRYMEVIRYMNLHLNRKLTREELASLLHIHPNYLDRMFREQFEKTPMQMLRELRLKKVKHLLESTDEPLHAVALQCGLPDASYLIKAFHKHYGISPGQHRARTNHMKDIYDPKEG
jgi:AraC-like DNA-binding protein